MIKFIPISTADVLRYSYMEKLITTAFPADEYRALDQLRQYTDAPNSFTNHVVQDDDRMIGIFTCWDFDDFVYIEHFATDPEVRNGGYGKKIMETWCKDCPKPIVLEVEEPVEEMSRRRVGFYERLGYKLWKADYQQPPYKEGDHYLPMRIMAFGNLECEHDYEKIKHLLYTQVYGVEPF